MRKETKEKGRRFLRPLINFLADLVVVPSTVTLSGLFLSVIAGLLFSYGLFFWGGVVVFLVGLCDTIDGELARITGRTSLSGAVLDSVVDRLSEGVIFVGIVMHYLKVNRWVVLVILWALIFSYMVSYVRARAEGVGRTCQVGMFERPIRVLVVGLSAIALGPRYFPIGAGVIALGSMVTFLRRLLVALRP